MRLVVPFEHVLFGDEAEDGDGFFEDNVDFRVRFLDREESGVSVRGEHVRDSR